MKRSASWRCRCGRGGSRLRVDEHLYDEQRQECQRDQDHRERQRDIYVHFEASMPGRITSQTRTPTSAVPPPLSGRRAANDPKSDQPMQILVTRREVSNRLRVIFSTALT